MSTPREILTTGEMDRDINQIKDLFGEIVNKYNDIFRRTKLSGKFLTDCERSKVAGEVFRKLDRYKEIIKNYCYMDL